MDATRRRVALIVEDEPAWQEAMTRYAKGLYLEAVVARDYYSAVTALETCVPDVIVVSLRLPNESGCQLCEYIRGCSPLEDVPIIVTCEGASIENMAHAEEAGAHAILEKPFTLLEFARAVESVILYGAVPSQPEVLRP
jgi:DNA-binding response OmpR family regulator